MNAFGKALAVIVLGSFLLTVLPASAMGTQATYKEMTKKKDTGTNYPPAPPDNDPNDGSDHGNGGGPDDTNDNGGCGGGGNGGGSDDGPDGTGGLPF